MNAKDLHIEYHAAQESPWLKLARRIVLRDILRKAAIKEGTAHESVQREQIPQASGLGGE